MEGRTKKNSYKIELRITIPDNLTVVLPWEQTYRRITFSIHSSQYLEIKHNNKSAKSALFCLDNNIVCLLRLWFSHKLRRHSFLRESHLYLHFWKSITQPLLTKSERKAVADFSNYSTNMYCNVQLCTAAWSSDYNISGMRSSNLKQCKAHGL